MIFDVYIAVQCSLGRSPLFLLWVIARQVATAAILYATSPMIVVNCNKFLGGLLIHYE
jgi:hypothetical protein